MWRRQAAAGVAVQALLPLMLLIAIIIVGSQLGVANIIYIAMVTAVVASMVLFHKHIDSQRDVLSNGAKAALGPALFTSAAVGVGTVAAASVGFTVIYEAIFNMPGGTYVSAATMAPCSAASWAPARARWASSPATSSTRTWPRGVNPAALAKIIATSATIGGALPNSGAMFGMLAGHGAQPQELHHKHIAAISIGAGLCALIVMIVMANIGIV